MSKMDQQVSLNASSLNTFSDSTNYYFENGICALSYICGCFNIGLIFYTCFLQKKNLRRLSALGVNLSVCAAIGSAATVWSFTGGQDLLDTFSCSGIEFLRNFCGGLFPITVLAISHERMRQLKLRRRKVSLFIELPLLWALSLFGCFPSAFTQSYNKEMGKCRKNPLLSNLVFTVIYECGRFLVFHLVVCTYMIMEMYKLRSKARYVENVKSPQPWKLNKRLGKIRFLRFISLIFTVIWLPFGVYHTRYKILQSAHLATFPSYSKASYIMAASSFIISIGLPIAIFIISEGSRKNRNGESTATAPENFSNFSTFRKSDTFETRSLNGAELNVVPPANRLLQKGSSLPDIGKFDIPISFGFEQSRPRKIDTIEDFCVQKETLI